MGKGAKEWLYIMHDQQMWQSQLEIEINAIKSVAIYHSLATNVQQLQNKT